MWGQRRSFSLDVGRRKRRRMQQVLQVRDRARTMNVQRPDEPRHAYAQLAPVWPAPHAPVPDDGTQGTNQGPVPGAHGGCTPAEPHHRGQCASSRAAFRRCSGCMWGACCQPNEQCTACRVCEPVVFANQMQHASSSTDEPMISRHRSLPCQCDTCAVGRSALHVGEIDEWGGNVQRHDSDRGKRTTRGRKNNLK